MVGFMTLDRNFVTNPNTTTVISDQNGRSTSTSTDRALMYSSCSKTALMRSGAMAVTSRDLQEHVFQRRLFDVHVADFDLGVGDRENSCRHARGVGGDDYLGRAWELDIRIRRAQRLDHSLRIAAE